MFKTLEKQRFDKIIYIGIGCCVAITIILISLITTLNKKKNNSKIDINLSENNEIEMSSKEDFVEEVDSSLGKTVDEVSQENNNEIEIQLGNNDNKQNEYEEKVEETANVTDKKEVNVANKVEKKETPTVVETVKDPEFIMPVEGEIVKKYGKDKLIYSETLKEWTTHLGIDIKADKTTVVKSASEGTVKSIKNDPRYGLTVVIEHKNGFSSVYSNLLTAEFVVVGEKVKAGQTIGTVGNTATFEILDDSHLHFEILKDGNSVDPEMYIK